MQASLRSNIIDVHRYAQGVQRTIPQAQRMALNKVLVTVRAGAVKAIAKDTGIKASEVRKALSITRATRDKMTASVNASRRGKAINLIEFVKRNRKQPADGPGSPQFFRKRYRSNSKKRGYRQGDYRWQGVEAKAWRKTKVYKGAFIGKTKDGVRVLKRTGRSRKQVTVVSGPSVSATFARPYLTAEMTRIAAVRYPIEYERAIKQLARQGKI